MSAEETGGWLQQPTPQITCGVLFLRRKRAGFDPEWGQQMEEEAREHLAREAFSAVVPDVRVVDDASLRAAVAECRRRRCDVLITLQTTMSDGRLAPVLGQLWEDPVILWATPEKQEGSMISACSLVGIHTFASTLRQLGRHFGVVYGMPGRDATVADLGEAVHIAYAFRRLRQARAGLVGYHAPGFIDMHADPFLMNRALGVQLHHVSIKEFLDQMGTFGDAEVAEDVSRTMGLGLPLVDVTREELATASRYYLTMASLIESESLDALAVRDWTELSDGVGQWPYLAMARLSSAGRAIGCEGDVDGALSCLLGWLLGCGAAYLSDWLEHDESTVTLWHAGNAPFQVCHDPGTPHGPRVSRHFNNRRPAVVDAWLRSPVDITILRLWHCDGAYWLTACDAESVPPRRELRGTNGLARIADRDVRAWFGDLCQAGMPHHVAVVLGHHAELVRRFARQTGVGWVD